MDKKKYSHLEDALFNNPAVSVNDRTGCVNTPPEDESEADNLAELVSVPVTSKDKIYPSKRKKIK